MKLHRLVVVACAATLARDGRANDQLLVTAYTSDGVTRHDAVDGSWIDSLPPAVLDGVLGCAIGPDGALYVCSELTNRVERFDATTGAHLGPFIFDDPLTVPDETGGLNDPAGIVFSHDDVAYVCSFANDSVLEYDGRSGAFLRVLVAPGGGLLNGPDAGLTFGPGGDLYVPSYFTNRVKRYSRVDGSLVADLVVQAGTTLSRPRTVVFPGDGFVYVTSEANDRVIQCDENTGAFVRFLVWNDPATPQDDTGGLDGPTGLAFGPDGRVYVASSRTNAVLRYDASTGAFIDVFVAPGSGGMQFPAFLLFRPDADNYGPLTPNSFSAGATLVANGSCSLVNAQLTFELHGAPPGELAFFFYGANSAQTPFGDGNLLVAHLGARRLGAATIDAFGRASHALDFAAASQSSLPLIAGAPRYFQAYVRDPNGPLGSGFNLSDGVSVLFAP